MTSGMNVTSSSGLYGALTFHHARVETSGRHALTTLRLEGIEAARPSFDAFRRELEGHLEAEERWMLPSFARFDPQACEAIRLEHARIRDGIARASRSLDARAADERPLHELLELLVLHCQREESELYRWAETAIGEEESRAVLQKIEIAESDDPSRAHVP